MAAVTNPASLSDLTLGPAYVTPPGMEVVDRGYATQDIKRGDPVVISGAAPSRLYDFSVANATTTDAIGIAIKTVKAGGLCEIATQGELDGYSGMTPNARLSVVSGKLDTTAPVAGQPYFIRAINSTRIRFVFV